MDEKRAKTVALRKTELTHSIISKQLGVAQPSVQHAIKIINRKGVYVNWKKIEISRNSSTR